MKVQGEAEVQLYSFFNLGARWGWDVNTTPWPLCQWEREPLLIVQQAGWALGQSGFNPQTIQPIASNNINYAIPVQISSIFQNI